LQFQIDLRAPVNLQFDARALDLAKAWSLGRQPVTAGMQRDE
jgi:hypothetical protein